VKSTRGGRRALSDAQVQRILIWNMRVQILKELRKDVPTLRAFSRANRVDQKTLLRWVPVIDQKIRLLIRVRDWGRAQKKLQVARMQLDTLRGLAKEFGVSDTTIQSVVRRKGAYKQVSPELVAQARAARRVRLERLRQMNLY